MVYVLVREALLVELLKLPKHRIVQSVVSILQNSEYAESDNDPPSESDDDGDSNASTHAGSQSESANKTTDSETVAIPRSRARRSSTDTNMAKVPADHGIKTPQESPGTL